jgi:RIO kinase 1
VSESLGTLLADGVIDGVLGQLKSGKEAEVWLVQHQDRVLAAKIYKERHERNFKNSAGYREGREVRNSRTRRAMEKGTRFGQAASEEAWKSAEAESLYKLHAQGVRVPTPVLFYEGILLMELVLDAQGHPAPRMVDAAPRTAEEARALYLDLRAQAILMLCADLIHGDLSAYNILMAWNGAIIIDFPQTLAAARNSQAEFYFRRDLENVRGFLAGVDPGLHDHWGDGTAIWNAYVRRELSPGFAPGPGRRQERAGHKPGSPAAASLRAPPPAEPGGRQMPPTDPLEAELQQLEATILRQGGGERPRPMPAKDPRAAGRPSGPRRQGPGRGGPSRPGGGARPPGPAGPKAPPRTAGQGGGQPRSNGAPAAASAQPRGGGRPNAAPGNGERRGGDPRARQAASGSTQGPPRERSAGGASAAAAGPARGPGRPQAAATRANGPGSRGKQPQGGGGGKGPGKAGQGRGQGAGRAGQRPSGPQVSYVSRPGGSGRGPTRTK